MKKYRLAGPLVLAILVQWVPASTQALGREPSPGVQGSDASAHAGAHTGKPFYLHNGDRVVFYGDSITQQRFYTNFVETYMVTRFPHLQVSFVNSGWGGDRSVGGKGGPVEVRMARDVITYKPTAITIMLGMNDGRYRPFNPEVFHTFTSGYEEIVETLKSALPGLRFTLLEPSPYDDVTRQPRAGLPAADWAGAPGTAGYNGVLVKFSDFVRQYAAKKAFEAADLNTPVVAMLEKAKALDPTAAQGLLPDRVHPGPGGHLIMAEALLKAWNAPAVVSSVRINASTKAIDQAQNSRVYDVNVEGQNVSWTQVDFALPMPINVQDSLIALAVKCSDVVEALNQELLAVSGLPGERYTLKIDSEEVGVFSGRQLQDGVNLAMLRTPMSEQAAEVHELTVEHNDVHFARWRTVQVPLEKSPGEADEAIKALDDLDNTLVRAQHNTAQPRIHHFAVSPRE